MQDSVKDIARLIRPGGDACIIFPCGNKNSFEERLISSMDNGRIQSTTGETIFFYEKDDGHLRRMESNETIDLFAIEGLYIKSELYSGQFFSSIDWLVRGTGPRYIKKIFKTQKPASTFKAIQLSLMCQFFLWLHRFLRFKELNIRKPRNQIKQFIVIVAQKFSVFLNNIIISLALWEWNHRSHNRNGSAQYLLFQKNNNS